MQYPAIPCNTKQYPTISCNTMHYHAIQCNTMQYHLIPCNTIQYHAIQCNTMQYQSISCNTIQYHAIQCNTMHYLQYHAILSYYVGSIILLFLVHYSIQSFSEMFCCEKQNTLKIFRHRFVSPSNWLLASSTPFVKEVKLAPAEHVLQNMLSVHKLFTLKKSNSSQKKVVGKLLLGWAIFDTNVDKST